MRRTWNVLILIVIMSGLVFSGQQTRPAAARPEARPEVILPDRTDTSGALGHMKELPDQAGRKQLPRKEVADRIGVPSPAPEIDPALDPTINPDAGTNGFNFDGVNARNGVLPPDTNGDVGPNHYVQWVNSSLQIWSLNRTTNIATSVYGPVNGNTIWSGFGGACETTNSGDPIVLYDQAADRWMISQFALPNFPAGPFYQCIAVSQTPNPTGAWHRYSYIVSNTKMNDYPHFGVWPDGYYMSVNQFNQNSLGWAGAGAVVFERSKMLTGDPLAKMVYFDLNSVDPNLGGMLPADWDGTTPPPAGAANVFSQFDDDIWGYSPDQLQFWNFHVDWTTPANSTFTYTGQATTAAFDYTLCGGSRNCIPQPGGIALDTLSDRLMHRLQYRNFGSYQTLVANHSVDVNGSDRAGVRWYELRRSTANGNWSIQQQGTYSPDATHRWMGSIAMNGSGQIALGYSASSTTVFPSIRYTGRNATDPLNTMSQGENILMAGGGSQSHSSGRWGDYSNMSVDPTDDCTFWFTSEYYSANSSASWQTRIGSFTFPGCGVPVDPAPTASVTNPAEGGLVVGTINLTATANDNLGVTQVQFFVDGASVGTDTTAGDGWSVSWNSASVGDGAHSVTATATDTIGQTGSDSNNFTVDNVTDVAVHSGSLTSSKTLATKNWKAIVTVTVHNAAHAPVSGVTVNYAWSGGFVGSGSCVTNAAGQCSATTGNINNRKTVTYKLNNLSGSGFTYTTAANHNPSGAIPTVTIAR